MHAMESMTSSLREAVTKHKAQVPDGNLKSPVIHVISIGGGDEAVCSAFPAELLLQTRMTASGGLFTSQGCRMSGIPI